LSSNGCDTLDLNIGAKGERRNTNTGAGGELASLKELCRG